MLCGKHWVLNKWNIGPKHVKLLSYWLKGTRDKGQIGGFRRWLFHHCPITFDHHSYKYKSRILHHNHMWYIYVCIKIALLHWPKLRRGECTKIWHGHFTGGWAWTLNTTYEWAWTVNTTYEWAWIFNTTYEWTSTNEQADDAAHTTTSSPMLSRPTQPLYNPSLVESAYTAALHSLPCWVGLHSRSTAPPLLSRPTQPLYSPSLVESAYTAALHSLPCWVGLHSRSTSPPLLSRPTQPLYILSLVESAYTAALQPLPCWVGLHSRSTFSPMLSRPTQPLYIPSLLSRPT